MEKTNNVIDKINTNKYFVGIMMIVLTIGGRFIIGELDIKTRDKVTNNEILRRPFLELQKFLIIKKMYICINFIMCNKYSELKQLLIDLIIN